MAKRKQPEVPDMHSPLESIVPKVPAGVLGTFIQRKLREYVEPVKEGTPKGEPIGLSRQKYYTALLSYMTALDSKKMARAVGISYALLRKWRTEDAFFQAGSQAVTEFIDDDFDSATKNSLGLLIGQDLDFGPEWADALVEKINAERLIGFDDAALYSLRLLLLIQTKQCEQAILASEALGELVEKNEELKDSNLDLAIGYLAWTYCLDKIARKGHRSMRNREAREQARRSEACTLSTTIHAALIRKKLHESFHSYAYVGSRVLIEILKS